MGADLPHIRSEVHAGRRKGEDSLALRLLNRFKCLAYWANPARTFALFASKVFGVISPESMLFRHEQGAKGKVCFLVREWAG